MQAPFLLAHFTSSVQAFEDNIGLGWLANSHHFNLFVLYFDNFGEGALANFALEFGEVVGSGDVIYFLLNFTVDPLFKAPHMYFEEGPLALAWRN